MHPNPKTMNNRELENLILLRQSGELSDAEIQRLEEALRGDPALAALAESHEVLLEAGRFSSAHCVPPLPDLSRERILQAAPSRERPHVKRLLALAALLVLGLALAQHLRPSLQPAPEIVATEMIPARADLDAEDPILSSLEELADELSLWKNLEMGDPAFLENEEDWAKILNFEEESI
ncbi:MAG: anti-sigma factor family protein [Kiritimatiellia bacterium]